MQDAADGLASGGNQQPGLVGLFSAFRAQTPQMYVDIDRERCKAMKVPLNEVFLTLQLYLGGYYTNDFNQFGRTWQVNVQGEASERAKVTDIYQINVRNRNGDMVPVRAFANARLILGPQSIVRYNNNRSVTINGGPAAGRSSAPPWAGCSTPWRTA